MTDQLPAPEATEAIAMSLCRCQKSKCNSKRCVCKQEVLVCTKMCGCIDCENELKEFE